MVISLGLKRQSYGDALFILKSRSLLLVVQTRPLDSGETM
jgi:hypothetical protein